MVDPEIRYTIPDGHVSGAVGLAQKYKDADGDCQAKIAEQDQFGILGLVQRTVWVEVVDSAKPTIALSLPSTLGLTFMIVVSSCVG